MSTNLIAHLKKKCEEDDNVKILLSQWEFDQKLVGKALENIGGFYPHFSNHNASHSQQILVNIERILGNDIDLLSATDTWLILEAAYWHDVGMLVDAKNAKAVHTNSDFNFMIQTIANEKGHDLQKFCQAYVEQNWLSAVGTESHPFDGIEKYRQLVAEWFRRGHDKRVGKIVEDPFKDLGITSPRTELLPNRIYRYLGQICVSHGMNFDTLMGTLPYKQTGLGTEDCHPRFIGCLLRLGDLFDLDDNRFCPVMAKHVSNMPSVSKHHHDKHLSLREFQLDKRTVKLVAECPDEMSYVETQNWFGWIREEFQNQMSQWNLIVPSLKFGSLPTIEQLDVRMEVKYQDGVKKEKILLNNKPMKFTIDEKNGMELLQGANLYSSHLSIYRELIQNSIDATMLRIWLEEDQEKLRGLNPYHEDFKKILKKYPLSLSIEQIKSECSPKKIWRFVLSDSGVGISCNDLTYMTYMAGSNKNLVKKRIINNMPLWMRPSGEFGIGLHSVFLLTENLPEEYRSINFKTRSLLSNDCLEIQMNSPLGMKNGYCFITKIDDVQEKIGTELSFFIQDDELLLKKEICGTEEFNRIWNIDFRFEKAKEYFLQDSLFNICNNSPIFLKDSNNSRQKMDWYETKNIAYRFSLNKPSDYQEIIGFRGQNAKNSIISDWRNFPFYMALDYYGLKANKSLEINRDNWRGDFRSSIVSDINEILLSYIKSGSDETYEKSVFEKMLLKNKTKNKKWGGFKFDINNKKISCRDMLEFGEIYIYRKTSDYMLRIYFDGVDGKSILQVNNHTYRQIEKLSEYFYELNENVEIYTLDECVDTEAHNTEYFDILFISTNGSKPIDEFEEYIYSWNKVHIKEYIDEELNKNDPIGATLNSHIELLNSKKKSYLFFDNIDLISNFKNIFIYFEGKKKIISPYQFNQNGFLQYTDLKSLINFIGYYKDETNLDLIEHEYKIFSNLIDKKIDELNFRSKFFR